MQLRYRDANNIDQVVPLGDEPVVIGRADDVDISLADVKASRRHCEVRSWAGDYVLKDLSSQNGTFLNGTRVSVGQLKPGDELRIGESTIMVEEAGQKHGIGENTAIRQISHEMDDGKGFGTILREIVHDIDEDSD